VIHLSSNQKHTTSLARCLGPKILHCFMSSNKPRFLHKRRSIVLTAWYFLYRKSGHLALSISIGWWRLTMKDYSLISMRPLPLWQFNWSYVDRSYCACVTVTFTSSYSEIYVPPRWQTLWETSDYARRIYVCWRVWLIPSLSWILMFSCGDFCKGTIISSWYSWNLSI
jgi:hypothetical protein